MNTAAVIDDDPDEVFAGFDDDTKRLAVELAPVLSVLSEESKYHLTVGLGARLFDGVGGDLLLRFPRRVKEHPVVKWIGGGIVTLSFILLTCVGIHTTSSAFTHHRYLHARKTQARATRVCRSDTGWAIGCVRRW